MRPLGSHQYLWIVLLGLLLFVSGCSGDSYQLPSISDNTSNSGQDDLTKAAWDYYYCLQDSGIPATIQDASQGGIPTVQLQFDPHDFFIYDTPEGIGGSSETLDEATKKAFEQATPGYRLAWNGRDESVSFSTCHSVTGYQEHGDSPAQENALDPALWSKIMESSIEWTACAREHGWPDVSDPDAASEVPIVLLPSTITEDQLRSLINQCPVQQYGNQDNDGVLPNIGFDCPSFDGQPNQTVTANADCDATRLAGLVHILYPDADETVGMGEGPR